jgi:hypothetical protein
LQEALKKYNESDSVKVSAHFKADVSGILSVDKVEAVVEYTTFITQKVKVRQLRDVTAVHCHIIRTNH